MSELYELPEGWEWKKLDEITELITKGTTPTTNGYKFLNNGINFLKIENIVNGKINLSTIEMFISEEAHQSQRRSQLKENDVLFSIAGTIGDTAIVTKEHLPMNINQAIALIRPKERLSSIFLKYSLLSIVSQSTKDKQRGGAIKNISLTDIKNTDFPLPPLQEQKRIVAKLDTLFEKIDRAIALHQKNMDEANAFMGSVLNDVFEELEGKYPLTVVSSGIEKILTGTTPPKKESKYYNNPTINWYSPSDFGKSKLLEKSKNMISEKAILDKKAKIYDKNTLLLVAIGATVGKIGVIRNEASSNQQITALKFKDEIEVDFSYYWFYYIRQIIIQTASTATMPIINQKGIKNLKFIIPPLKIQQKTVNYLDKISLHVKRVKEVQKEKMEHLKALKASILDQAFRGQL